MAIPLLPKRNTFNVFRSLLRSLLLSGGCLAFLPANGQTEENTVKINPIVGISWRSTAMNFFNFKYLYPDDFTKKYPYEKNVQGLSISPGLQLSFFDFLVLDYHPGIRYDVVHHYTYKKDRIFTGVGPNGDSAFVAGKIHYKRDWLFDHHFSLFFRKSFQVGFGMSIINNNKGYYFVNPTLRYHNIEFKTYNVAFVWPVKDLLNLELKALYVPKDFPYNVKEDYIMYSIRAYRAFKLSHKEKRTD